MLACSLLGCAAEFDSQSEVKTLRVLGVQKDKPYAQPGDDVKLSMLWHDGADVAPRDVQVLWLSGCFNPAGDLFAGCFEDFDGLDLDVRLCDPDADIGICLGNDYTFKLPSDIISERPPPQDSTQPRYGLAYVFFAVCGGFIGPSPALGEELAFPIACFEDQAMTKRLGPDHFVAGYTAVYAYETITNANPVITGFEFNGVEVQPQCTGVDCVDQIQSPPPEVDCSTGDTPCVFACPDDGEDECPKFEIKPIIDRASAEEDPISSRIEGRDLQEQMWVNYYVERGSVSSDVRLVNDSFLGWNDELGTDFRAPAATGPTSIWAVVHDNRGGADWARLQVLVN